MTVKELTMLQSLPLEIKIEKTKARLKEYIEHFGLNHVYISYSGGKDSEVLLDIARQLYPNIKAVFINTGQEYPETIKQVLFRKKQGYNIDIITPKMRYKDIIKKYGYPCISKEQALYIEDIRTTKSEKMKKLRLFGRDNGSYKLSEKWKYLLNENLKISPKCCTILKKNPIKIFEKETERKGIVGTMASESSNRLNSYLKTGCNSFESNRPMSRPLGFWREEDIWNYINTNNLKISEMYTIYGAERTGCYGCLFGCHLEEQTTGSNRIIKLKNTHPYLYTYLMEKLNYKKVMKILRLKTEEIQKKLF